MNFNISIVSIAQITSKLRNYPTRIPCKVEGRQGQIVLDQIRTVDKVRLFKKVDTLNKAIRLKVLNGLKEMFGE